MHAIGRIVFDGDDLTPARLLRLAIIRHEIAAGTYESEAKIDATVDAVVDELTTDPGMSS